MTKAITAIIPTYDRPKILEKTVTLLLKNLKYDHRVDVLIGNDGDDLPDSFPFGLPGVEVIPGPKRGLGANLNMLIKEAKTDLILQMDDDHQLVRPLDINQFAEDLSRRKNGIGWIRLFLGTEEDLNNDDPFYQFEAKMLERYWYPTPGGAELYIASNRPHLKTEEFHEKWYGYYPEDESLGRTETLFCHQYIKRHRELNGASSRPWVVIPVAAPSFDTWQHVGQSYQRQGY